MTKEVIGLILSFGVEKAFEGRTHSPLGGNVANCQTNAHSSAQVPSAVYALMILPQQIVAEQGSVVNFIIQTKACRSTAAVGLSYNLPPAWACGRLANIRG